MKPDQSITNHDHSITGWIPDRFFWPAILLGLILIAVTRWPHIAGPGAILDGDEAILGLMAKHLSEGARLSWYFYGQNFGVTIIENLTASAFFLVFGISAISLKASTLFLWIGGWLLFVCGVRRLAGTSAALVAGYLLLSAAAWGLWPTLARGYHVGGFAIAQLCFWLVAGLYNRPPEKPQLSRVLVLGISAGLLFMTQKIWLLSILPFIALLGWRFRNARELTTFVVGAIFSCSLPLLASTGSGYWDPNYLQGMDPIASLLNLPGRAWVHFSGAYSYATRQAAGTASVISASLWLVYLPASFYLLTRQRSRPLMLTVLLSLILVVSVTLFIGVPAFGYRYLLPTTVLISLTLALTIDAFPDPQRMRTAIVLLVVTMVPGLLAVETEKTFRSPKALQQTSYSGAASMAALIKDLQSAEVRHVYSLGPMLQWQIMFSSNENILARWSDSRDRLPHYPQTVDRAFFAGNNTALVGSADQLSSLLSFLQKNHSGDMQLVASGDRYFWLLNPDQKLLEGIGFQLNTPDALSFN
jgi:hypothetical protein